MLKFIGYDEARDILLSLPIFPATEEVKLDDTLDRVLAEDVFAAFPMPPFDKSPFDGYAFRGEDTMKATQECPAALRIVGETAAGDPAGVFLEPGTAVKIFTGAPVPPGANATIKFELTQTDGATVLISKYIPPDTNVIQTGEDYGAGALLALKGTRLSPPLMGVLASQGIDKALVYRRPVVSIISTGSELSEVGEPRPEFGIYNSSYYSISGYLRRMGFDVRFAGTIPDDAGMIEEATARCLEDSDLVVTTGGASVGDYDFAVRTAENIGAKILFWKVNMKPGGAILAAMKNGKLLLSLSGNPAAALMILLVLAQPYLRRLCGQDAAPNNEIVLPLKRPLPKTSTSLRLLRGHLEVKDGNALFAENEGRGNGNQASFDDCDLIGMVPADSGELPAGTMIRAYRLPHDVC